ncbi:MAG TPA: lipopolysaccharide kinase InaA family protein [Nitrospiria bacterium]|nr:lipopolysaccharide kinase InaA family protein [Nitrospiria bacterium]
MTDSHGASSDDHMLVSVKHRGWRGQVISVFTDPAVLDRYISIRDAIQRDEATVIKDIGGRAVTVIQVPINGRTIPVIVKQDDLMVSGVRALLKSHLKSPHVRKAWRWTLRLRDAGVSVPAPVALLERRRWGVLCTTVFVGEYLPNAAPLAHLLRRGDVSGTDRDDLLATLARELRFMHDCGFYHGDLKPVNILAEHRADGWIVTFIDLEGVAAKPCLTERERAIDLGRLRWALIPLMDDPAWERFLEAYATIAPSIDLFLLRRVTECRIEYLSTRRFGDLPRIGTALLDAPDQPHRWLIVALDSPRRVIQAIPLLVLLRWRFPSLHLDLLVHSSAAPLLARHPDMRVATLLPDASMMSTIKTIRSRHYQVVIDVTNGVRSAALTRASSAKIRIGYRTASTLAKWINRATWYTHMIVARPEHRLPEDYFLMVAEALGVDCVGRPLHKVCENYDKQNAAPMAQSDPV